MNRQLIQGVALSLLVWNLIAPSYADGQSAGKSGLVIDSISKYRTIMATRYPTGVSAHRGNSQLAPENTLATYLEVLKMQVDYIEIDVRTTQDGQLVILHDGTLNRTTSGTGPLKEQTLSALRELSAGKGFGDRFQTERIPTLDEVCQLVSRWNAEHAKPTNLYVDCKEVAPAPLVKALERYKLLKNAVFYGSDETLLALKQVAPEARIMPSLKKAEDMSGKINKLHPYAFDLSWSAINETLIQQIHQQGIKAFADLLGPLDTAEYYRKVAQMHLDVIQTDYVVKVYQTLAEPTH